MSIFLVRRACLTFLSCSQRSIVFFSSLSISKVFFLQLGHSLTELSFLLIIMFFLSRVILFFSCCKAGSAIVVYSLLSNLPKQFYRTLLYLTSESPAYPISSPSLTGVILLLMFDLPIFFYLLFWNISFCCLYLSILRTSFL